MSLRLKTFEVRDGAYKRDDEEAVDSFLHSVAVERIDTAYAEGGWRVLVLFHDTRHKEEAAQIASVIAAALKDWRAEKAAALGENPADLLPDDAIDKVAHYVPTTAIELRVVMGVSQEAVGPHAEDIVRVVRRTLGELA
jgi:ribonuclease D